MDIGVILLILAIVVFVAMLRNASEDAAKERHSEMVGLNRKDCPPHKWAHHPVTDKLTCTICNYVAGSDFTPRGSNDSPY